MLFHIPEMQQFVRRRRCDYTKSTCPSCMIGGTYVTALQGVSFSLNYWRELIAAAGLEPSAQEDMVEFWEELATLWSEAVWEEQAKCLVDWGIFSAIFGHAQKMKRTRIPNCECGFVHKIVAQDLHEVGEH